MAAVSKQKLPVIHWSVERKWPVFQSQEYQNPPEHLFIYGTNLLLRLSRYSTTPHMSVEFFYCNLSPVLIFFGQVLVMIAKMEVFRPMYSGVVTSPNNCEITTCNTTKLRPAKIALHSANVANSAKLAWSYSETANWFNFVKILAWHSKLLLQFPHGIQVAC